MYRTILIRICSVCLLLSISFCAYAQRTTKLDALNTYVEFLNESVHGLTVAHILFSNYNKDLNKYVDLDSHKINAFMTNDEVGVSIFDNPDISTSDNNNSALKLSKISEERSKVLQPDAARNFNNLVSEIVSILNNINSLRFEIESFITSSDLNQKENIYKSYEMLERAVGYFEGYSSKHDRLMQGLQMQYKAEKSPIGKLFRELHKPSVNMIMDLRKDNTGRLDKYISQILGALDKFDPSKIELKAKQQKILNEIIVQSREMTAFVTKQMNSSVPENYKLYSNAYYMHNHVLLSYFNSISPGFVSKMNAVHATRNNSFIDYDDRPIRFKVTYPEKMQEIESIATNPSLNSEALNLPVVMKMDIDVPQEPEQDYVELEFFDPDLIDRDSISVSWNDEWLLTDYKLEAEPKKIRLDIDPLKGNSIFILAKNEGIIAPNTVGFKYRFNGKGKKTYIRKMMLADEGYELVLTIDGLGGFSDSR